jgi:hypothetical protein
MVQPPSGPHDTLSYQEALRSLGALLDAAVAPRATLRVGPDGITVEASGLGTHHYQWQHIAALAEARTTLRGRGGSARPRLTSWEALLRLAGRALDLLRLPRFEIHAAVATPAEPTRCYIEVTVEGRRVLGEAEVIEQLMEVEAIRRARGEVDDAPD